MGGYHTKENSSNGNLRWRSIVTKDTNDPKGWPHPEGRQRRRNTVEGSLSTRPEKRNPGWRISTDPWEGRTAVRTNASRSPQQQPEVVEPHEDQKQTQPKEGKQHHDRGLRKNTDRTWDRWPNMKSRNTTGPRSPEAQQRHEGKPTSTWQRTRLTTSTANLRREDNQG